MYKSYKLHVHVPPSLDIPCVSHNVQVKKATEKKKSILELFREELKRCVK